MHIKFLNNGAESHVSNEVGRGFITAGLAEEVKKAAPVWQPVWSIERDMSNGFVFVRMKLGVLGEGAAGGAGTARVVQTYAGDPDLIHDRRDSTGRVYSSAFGRPVPDEILKEYKRAWKNPDWRKPESTYENAMRTDDTNSEQAKDLARMKAKPLPAISETDAVEAHAAVERERTAVEPTIIRRVPSDTRLDY